MGFETLIYALQNWGVIDVILPFVLIFTIVFAIIEKTQILGKDEIKARKYGAVIALVMAFAVVVPHVTGSYYYGFDVVNIINNALPQVSLLLVAVVMMLLTIGLWTGNKPSGSKGIGRWFTYGSLAIVIFIFLTSMNWIDSPYWLRNLLSDDVIALVMAILVFGIIIKFIVADDEGVDAKIARIKKEKENKKALAEAKGEDEFLKGD